jgi:enoyl-CoA hydratase/carnithine racemase
MPVVAAVQGLCLAGGIELALACDVLFAADDAKFGDQHAAFGLIPGWGGSQRLTRAIGLRRSLDMMFSARRIDAQTALDWGLVNYVSGNGNLRHDALDYARVLSTRNGDGLTAMKRLAYLAAADGLTAGLRQEREEALPILMGKNVDEGLNAFKERRTPKFA